MPYRILNQRNPEAGVANPRTHVDILREHFAEAPHPVVDGAGKAHVESAWREFFQTHLTAAYAAGGEKGSHGIVDCFLGVRE